MIQIDIDICLELVIKLFCGIYFISTLENINRYFPFNVTHTLIALFLRGSICILGPEDLSQNSKTLMAKKLR